MSSLAIQRCDLRLSADDKYLLQYAAQLKGLSLASFIRQVAFAEAEKIVERDKVAYLSAKESKELIEALDQPLTLNDHMKDALNLADKIIQNTREYNNDVNL